MNSVDSSDGRSQADYLQFSLGKESAEPLLKEFEKTYGVSLYEESATPDVWRLYDRWQPHPTFEYVPRFGGALSWSDLAEDSLIVKAFHQLEKYGQASADDELVRCDYSLRPWITRTCKVTETIDATFTLQNPNGVKRVQTTFDR